jgi:hypothetical protein
MGECSEFLRQLGNDVFDRDEASFVTLLSHSAGVELRRLVPFDEHIGGPSIFVTAVTDQLYDIADRDVFRPLQYCVMYLVSDSLKEWTAREIVHMSGLHLESLVKRIGHLNRFPLGRALRERVVRHSVDAETWNVLSRFAKVYNMAKHHLPADTEEHLFSVGDAQVAYVLSRKIGVGLYGKARLSTDIMAVSASISADRRTKRDSGYPSEG